jgi:GrpB-like predicted nucleotidyltransferase (UPF0157 family)
MGDSVMTREIILVPYSKKWPKLYEAEKILLTGILGDLILDVQHFGSTSIKGMPAKPIIDIMIIVNNIEMVDSFNEKMEANGYTVKGENGIPGRRYFQKFNPDRSGNHTHHVHIFQKKNQEIRDELIFRDYLRIDREAFKEYENVKKEASKKFRDSPLDYTNAKTSCVMRIMDRAKAYFTSHK